MTWISSQLCVCGHRTRLLDSAAPKYSHHKTPRPIAAIALTVPCYSKIQLFFMGLIKIPLNKYEKFWFCEVFWSSMESSFFVSHESFPDRLWPLHISRWLWPGQDGTIWHPWHWLKYLNVVVEEKVTGNHEFHQLLRLFGVDCPNYSNYRSILWGIISDGVLLRGLFFVLG